MKGIAISTIIALVIGVIILIVLTPLLFKAASNVWDQLAETLGIVKYSPIERALICYYYLCKSDAGCRDPTFNDFCSPDKIGRENYEELCSLPASLAVDGRQCESPQFPLKIQLDKNEEIYKDRLKKKVDTEHLLIATDQTSGGINWREVILNIIILPLTFLTDHLKVAKSVAFFAFHSQDLTNIEEESYTLSWGGEYSHLVKFANVKSGTYYVSGIKSRDYIPKYLIFVDPFPRYLNLTPGKCYNNLEVSPDQIIRISVEDEKTENLKDYNYLFILTEISGVHADVRILTFSIKFWNATNAGNPATQRYTCKNPDCSEKKQFVFNTRKRTIKIEVQKVEYSLYCSGQGGCRYEISKFNLTVCRQ